MQKILVNSVIWPCRVLETGRWFAFCLAATSTSCNIFGVPEFECVALSRHYEGYASFLELINDIEAMEDEGRLEGYRSSWLDVRRQVFNIPIALMDRIQSHTFDPKDFVQKPHGAVLIEDARTERVPERIRPEWVVQDYAQRPCFA